LEPQDIQRDDHLLMGGLSQLPCSGLLLYGLAREEVAIVRIEHL